MADPLRTPRVVVVGAGVGGLVGALLLAQRGLAVTLVERLPTPGGKLRHVHVDGAPIDAGPTVFTMRWVFESIFAAAGTSVAERLRLAPLDVLARHAWNAESILDLFADRERSADAIARFAGPDEARRFVGFCEEARRIYALLEGPYIRSERPTLRSMAGDLGLGGLGALASLGPFASMWRTLARHFRDPRLQQLFGRYATYCGASPLAAPATLVLVAQVEMDGVWAVEGGMHALARALADLARERGAVLRYGQACEEIIVRDGRARGIRLAGGEVVEADAVVFNGDVNALAEGLLGAGARGAARPVPPGARSLSAITWLLRARAQGFPLAHHNVFFEDDYPSEFADIFGRGRLPRKGTVYACAPDRSGGARADGSPERLSLLVNAPATGDRAPGERGHIDDMEIDACERRSFALLSRCGLTLERGPQAMVRVTPRDFHRLFPATGGALYGPATHGWMSSFRRASSASALPGLYLAGGSVHPGPGVPMAAMSGRLAAETLLGHLASTSRSRRVVISGGMSTPSATTAGTG
jgi:1-hydroxycarotenoid 3,4-desaturase